MQRSGSPRDRTGKRRTDGIRAEVINEQTGMRCGASVRHVIANGERRAVDFDVGDANVSLTGIRAYGGHMSRRTGPADFHHFDPCGVAGDVGIIAEGADFTGAGTKRNVEQLDGIPVLRGGGQNREGEGGECSR